MSLFGCPLSYMRHERRAGISDYTASRPRAVRPGLPGSDDQRFGSVLQHNKMLRGGVHVLCALHYMCRAQVASGFRARAPGASGARSEAL